MNNTPSRLFLLSALLTLLSCSHSGKNERQKELYFYRNTHRKGEDSSSYFKRVKIKKHQSTDDLLAQSDFIYNGKRHTIRLYTNYFHCPIDAGRIYYELDQLGIIYVKSTSFYDYTVLKSTNDSINKIIERGLENIIFDPKLQVKMEMFAPKSK
jgi:hypothetical protein